MTNSLDLTENNQNNSTVEKTVSLDLAVSTSIVDNSREAANQTEITEITEKYIDREQELIAQMISTGHMAEGATMKLNGTDIYRFADNQDSEGKQSGWAAPFLNEDDQLIMATYGSYHDEDNTRRWEYSGFSAIPSDEQQIIRQKLDAKRETLSVERQKEQAKNSHKLRGILSKADKLTRHKYLDKKGVKSFGLLRGHHTELVIPLTGRDGKIITAQRIDDDGTKKLWSGCSKKGAFHKIVGDSKAILIAEGYSTAASLHQATGYTTIMAIDAGNLKSVAQNIKELFPNSAIIVCCDNDQYKEKNIGLEKGRDAAWAIGAVYIVPQFKDLSSKPTDFNDLHNLQGYDAINSQIKHVIEKAMLRIPEGFSLKQDGVYSTMTKKDGGGEYEVKICSPLKISALTRNTGNEQWGRFVEVTDPDSHVHKFALPMDMLAGHSADYLGLLAGKGFLYVDDKRKLLHQYISDANPITRARCVNKIGWYKGVFVLPKEVIGETAEMIVYQNKGIEPKGFEVLGTLEQWRDDVSSLCIGNSRLILSVALSFATALLDMIGGESGGFHFRSGSSRGKTTALMLAKSVWGSSEHLPRWRATANGLEGIAAQHNHSLLCLDEFSQLAEVSPKVAGEAIYMLGNGEGKQRSSKTGAMAERQNWQLLYLSAGEVSLKATMEQAGLPVRAGQEVRFIDLPADAGKGLGAFDTVQDLGDGNRFAIAIKERSAKYHGTAARAFLAEIAADYDGIKESLIGYIEEFVTQLDLSDVDPQVQRVAQRFALIAAAGEIASSLGITGWAKGQSNWAADVCFNAWLEERGGSGSHEEDQALETVRSRLLEHYNSRFVASDFSGNSNSHYANVWGYCENDGLYVYISAFKEHICAGLDPKYVMQMLASKGFIKFEEGVTPKTGKPNVTYAFNKTKKDYKPTKCVQVYNTFFGEEELPIVRHPDFVEVVDNGQGYTV